MPDNATRRSLLARVAAHESWACTEDRAERTAPARQAFNDRFEKQVDPDGVLPPQERAIRAEHARKAYFTRLAVRSAEARSKKHGTRTAARATTAPTASDGAA